MKKLNAKYEAIHERYWNDSFGSHGEKLFTQEGRMFKITIDKSSGCNIYIWADDKWSNVWHISKGLLECNADKEHFRTDERSLKIHFAADIRNVAVLMEAIVFGLKAED